MKITAVTAKGLRNAIGAVSVIVLLGGCAATQVALSKKDLDVQARTSTAIFVDPVPREKRTVYLDIKSGVMEFDRRKFKQFVSEQFSQFNDNGYKIIDDPDAAQFQMVVYVLNLEKASPTAAQAALSQGYMGGAIAGGAAIGAATNSNSPWAGAAVGGVAGGAAELISGALVKDVTFMLVSDVQIKEKAAKGVIVRKDSKIDTKISDAGTSQQTVSEATNKKEYRTRIVTTANKVNLKLEEAEELMFKKTAYAMAGFF
ncbi:MAG: complement resistance protein TraT [Gammaproteobacteria bacterium]|nr:complement resistance protein TraT [Gammaproteobacteria bacterium]